MLKLVHSSETPARDLSSVSDRELLESMQAGLEAALDELIERKTGPLLQMTYRILGDHEEARDVVQVTFVRVWEKCQSFDQRWSPNTWIYRIASNLAIDRLRARQIREHAVEPVRQHLMHVAEPRRTDQLSRLESAEVQQIFEDLAAELTDKQRLAFVLREVEGFSSREVAEVLGCRESTVRNHLFNARKVLRKELLSRYPEYSGASRREGV